MDAIALLKNDHQTVNRLFDRFEATGRHAYETRRDIVARIIEELSVHAAIEEQVLYPAVRRDVPGGEDLALESLEEHHVVKWLLSELEDLAPDDERYQAKATVLIENVRHHVEEEEHELFPKVRKALSQKQLDQLGDALNRAKELAPHRPHPRSPDAPPANLLTGPAAGVIDRVTDSIKDAAGAAVGLVTRTADKRLDAVEDATSDVVDSARQTADSAVRQAKTAVRKTAPSARKTAGSARKTAGSARRTARSAEKTAATASSQSRRAAKRTAGTAKRTPVGKKAAATTRKASASATAKQASRTAKKSTVVNKASTATRKASSTAKRPTKKAAATRRAA